MHKVIIGLALILVVATGVLVGSRVSQDAMAVVLGVVCGIGASIPVTLLILYIATRREVSADERDRLNQGQLQVPQIQQLPAPQVHYHQTAHIVVRDDRTAEALRMALEDGRR